MDKRPPLDRNISLSDFQDFYWLKRELQVFCREEGLRTTGKKLEIANRIVHYLKTGETGATPPSEPYPVRSKFDWKKAPLHRETIITDNYRNTENVRRFFRREIGQGFKFNVRFMEWMRTNVGKSLGDAITAWQTIARDRKRASGPKQIAPQFEYNRYLRDYLADNPNGDRTTGIALWKIKRRRRGDNVYRPEDLHLREEE
ncbi:MAG: DUF6434 domain-containing protein [Bacteroidota bacterium]